MDQLNSLYIRLVNFIREDRGASGVEYGIMIAAVSALIAATAFLIGGKIQTAFNTTNSAIP